MSRSLIARLIRDVPDFPKPGIMFKDITPLLGDGPAFRRTIELLADEVAPYAPEVIVACESRGFIFGAALAHHLGIGLNLVRKPGKLPADKIRETYSLEYGTDTLEMHVDPKLQGKRCVVIDDLLATGGTAAATAKLIERQGGSVEAFAFVIELQALGGRSKLGAVPACALLSFGAVTPASAAG